MPFGFVAVASTPEGAVTTAVGFVAKETKLTTDMIHFRQDGDRQRRLRRDVLGADDRQRLHRPCREEGRQRRPGHAAEGALAEQPKTISWPTAPLRRLTAIAIFCPGSPPSTCRRVKAIWSNWALAISDLK